MPESMSHIVIDGERHFDLAGQERLDFGRVDTVEGVVGLDPQDMGISRLAGSVHQADRLWMVTNRSETVPLYLDVDPGGQYRVLPPGQRHLVNDVAVVIVRGLRRMHRIDVLLNLDPSAAATVRPRVDTETSSSSRSMFTEGELDALTAVYRGFLVEFPRRECAPLTYEEAGALLGVPGSTVRKRVEKVRTKLATNGHYVEGANARWELAHVVLEEAIIDPSDLMRLERERPD